MHRSCRNGYFPGRVFRAMFFRGLLFLGAGLWAAGLAFLPATARAATNFDACVDDARQTGSVTTEGYVSYRCESTTAEKLSARPDACPVGGMKPALRNLARRQQQLDDGLVTTVSWTAGRCAGSCVMRSFDFKDTSYACEVRIYSHDFVPHDFGPRDAGPDESGPRESGPREVPRVADEPSPRHWPPHPYSPLRSLSQLVSEYFYWPYHRHYRSDSDWPPYDPGWRYYPPRPHYPADRLEAPKPRFWWGPEWGHGWGPGWGGGWAGPRVPEFPERPPHDLDEPEYPRWRHPICPCW